MTNQQADGVVSDISLADSTRMTGVLREFMERLRLKIKRITVPVDTAMGDWRNYACITLTALMTTSMEVRHLIQLWLVKKYVKSPFW